MTVSGPYSTLLYITKYPHSEGVQTNILYVSYCEYREGQLRVGNHVTLKMKILRISRNFGNTIDLLSCSCFLLLRSVVSEPVCADISFCLSGEPTGFLFDKSIALLANCFHPSFLLRFFFDREDEGVMFLRNVG
jgi:hypothetical protein